MTARKIAQKITSWVVFGFIGFFISVEIKSCNEAKTTTYHPTRIMLNSTSSVDDVLPDRPVRIEKSTQNSINGLDQPANH